MSTRPVNAALLGLALIAGVTPLAGTWGALIQGGLALALMQGAVLAVLGTGILARVARLRPSITVLVEFAVLTVGIAWFGSASGGIVGIPGLLAGGWAHLASSVAPVTPTVGSTMILCIAVGLIALVADLLVAGLNRPSLVLVPLLTLLLIPSASMKDHPAPIAGLPWFAWGLAIIWFTAQRRGSTGPRRLAARTAAAGTAALSACLALVIALVAAPRVPVPGPPEPTDSAIQMNDVSQDLKRQIRLGADTPALEYRSENGPQYLRLHSLPTFTGAGWHLTNSSWLTGPLPAPPGQDAPIETSRIDVTITGLRSEWLPAPYATVSTTAAGRWGYLPDSLSILAGDRGMTTAGMTYAVQARVPRPTEDQIRRAAAALPPDAALTTSVPSDITPELVQLSQQITRGESTPGGKALAILSYLKQPKFTYSLDALPGSGYDGLKDFLFRDNRGFCVQYAASMAILGRIAGLPTRMAVGFAPGKRTGDHYTVTMHDMHAWPEVYLGGYGWVAFEPTPSGNGAVITGEQPSAPSDSPRPTQSASSSETASASASPSETATPVNPEPTPERPMPVLVPLAALGVVGLAAVAATPWWIRRRRRTLRLAEGGNASDQALDAWAELRDTVRDYGRAWPPGSPRFAAEEIASWVPAGAAADGVRRLALATERAEFGGPGFPPQGDHWGGVVSSVAAALASQLPSRWARLRAVAWPASVTGQTRPRWRRPSGGSSSTTGS